MVAFVFLQNEYGLRQVKVEHFHSVVLRRAAEYVHILGFLSFSCYRRSLTSEPAEQKLLAMPFGIAVIYFFFAVDCRLKIGI